MTSCVASLHAAITAPVDFLELKDFVDFAKLVKFLELTKLTEKYQNH